MNKLPTVLLYPHKSLSTPALSVGDVDDRVEQLVNLMTDAMRAANGIGLAAPQVGVDSRVIVIDARDGEGLHVLINPEIVDAGGSRFYEEGCLSFPGIKGMVRRSEWVRVRARGVDGVLLDTGNVGGLYAHALQHEIDHLAGRCFVDRLDRTSRRLAIRQFETRQRALRHRPVKGKSKR